MLDMYSNECILFSTSLFQRNVTSPATRQLNATPRELTVTSVTHGNLWN